MSVESIEKFRERINDDSALQEEFLTAFQEGPAALVALAKANGFEFTEAEADAAIEELSQGGELSDFELELVSGGVVRGSILNFQPGSGGGETVNYDSGSVTAGGGFTSPPPPPPPPPPPSSGGGK